MKKNCIKLYHIATVLLLAVLLVACGTRNRKAAKIEGGTPNKQHGIVVFAAASLTDVLSEIVQSFEATYQVKVQTNMASSGTLARQIEQGGAPDVYISASKRWANYVDSLGEFLPGKKTEIAQNELVLIAPNSSALKVDTINSSLDFMSMLQDGRLSIGNPLHVPAGKYAKQALEYFGWFRKLNGKLLPAKDARSALMVVEMGETPIGIVYRTDAQKSQKVKILHTFPKVSHKPIVYICGVCKNTPSAKDFYNYLNACETIAIWEKYGFGK